MKAEMLLLLLLLITLHSVYVTVDDVTTGAMRHHASQWGNSLQFTYLPISCTQHSARPTGDTLIATQLVTVLRYNCYSHSLQANDRSVFIIHFQMVKVADLVG